MATLTHGPRLGAPSSAGFKVWVRATGAGTCVLEVKVNGTTTWATADTQAVDTSKYNTAVLTATGLSARTKYDYRVNVDGVNGTTYTTITMPTSGRFAVYQTTDCHDGNSTPGPTIDAVRVYQQILAHYEANYEPSGIPAFIVQYGDIFTGSGPGRTPTTWSDTFVSKAVACLDFAGATRKLPLLYMWDDWDFAANNSCAPATAFVGGGADALTVYDWFWRDAPQPAAPSRGFSVTVAGVPFIVLDQRSQRVSSNKTVPANTAYPWQDPATTANTALGAAQLAWVKSTLIANATKALVVLVNGTTWKNAIHEQRAPYAAGGIRDSVGIYHIAERNDIAKAIASYGYGWRNNLVLWTGDDHWCVVWKDSTRDNISPGDTTVTPAASYPSAPSSQGVPFLEFKVTANSDADSRNAGNSPILFGPGQFYSRDTLTQAPASDIHNSFVVWDITSSSAGEHVSARVTYVVAFCSTSTHAALSTEIDDLGRSGDFYFQDGMFDYYDTSVQHYPVENGASDAPMHQRWYVDDINGHMFPEERAVRDLQARLRDKKDIGDVDRDDLLRDYVPRAEGVETEP